MNAIHVHGGKPLHGEVKVQGSKNAALPILAATILIKGTCIIKNCPHISDVECMIKLLRCVGCTVLWDGNDIVVDAISLRENRLPREYVTGMRSSVMMMGALLGRSKEVSLDYPGGCIIGERPIDIHIEALECMGARIERKENGLTAGAQSLKGCPIKLRFPSVGATENVILAAVTAQGVTILDNCAKEPEIISLCRFLQKAGAKISGIGSRRLIIEGIKELNPVIYTVEADRIVAGTYLLSVMAAGGKACLTHVPVEYMECVMQTAQLMGGDIQVDGNLLTVIREGKLKPLPYLKTEVYPGFPTDLQSVLLVALSLADGESLVKETIFNNRFRMAQELNRMGSDITVCGQDANIRGNRTLIGRSVVAEDLRGGAALILAGICAQGDTFVNNDQYIERGYEDICRDFRLLGADVRRRCEETEIASKKEETE